MIYILITSTTSTLHVAIAKRNIPGILKVDQKKSCIKFYISFLIRIEGRLQCFTFVKDEGFELDEQRETRLMSFVEDNKVRLPFFGMQRL